MQIQSSSLLKSRLQTFSALDGEFLNIAKKRADCKTLPILIEEFTFLTRKKYDGY